MKSKSRWKGEYQKEIEHAILARSDGNEGMARVCARRAAGIIIGEYHNRRGYPSSSKSAYDQLTIFINDPNVDQRYKDIADHFLTKVDLDRNLPMKADLISEVIFLKTVLLVDSQD